MNKKLCSKIQGVEITTAEVAGMKQFVQRMLCATCPSHLDFRNSGGRHYPEEAIFQMARHKGWEPDRKGKHKCPNCLEEKMIKIDTTPREMTQAERRKIFREIDNCYDEKRGRYVDSETDQGIAARLAVPRKWVSDVREENFGPSGENDELERVAALLGRIDAELRQAVDDCLAAAANAESLKTQVDDARKRLDTLRSAFGPHRVPA